MKRPRPHAASEPVPWHSLEHAAALLDVGAEALRARCRRAQRDDAGRVVADLGGGVVAFKLGRSWRVRLP